MGVASSKGRGRPPDPAAALAPLIPASLVASALLRRPLRTTHCEDAAPPPPPPDAPPAPAPDDAIASAAASASSSSSFISNPGPYEQASMDAKRLVALDTFDGFRCDINKQVSPFMAAVHSFWLGTSMLPDRKSSYTFLTQVADDAGLLMARVDLGRGSVDGRVHRAVLGGLAMAKLQLGLSAEGQADQCLAELDFGGQTWTANVKYGSMGGGLIYGCNYFQAVTQNCAVGGEGMYVQANQKLLSNYTIKYTVPASTGDEMETLTSETKAAAAAAAASPLSSMGAATAAGSSTMVVNYNSGQQACTMNYKRVVTPGRVSVGAELTFSPFSLKSEVMLGAEFKLQRSKYSLCVDPANLRLQSVLETKLGMAPGSPSLQFAADVAPWTDEMRFGYGITVDG